MPELLRMPEVSADADSAVLASWPVAESASYAAGDVIVMIETAKAVVDVEADADGVLLLQLVTPGTEVRVGDPIALTAAPGETVADPAQALADLGVGVTGPATEPATEAATEGQRTGDAPGPPGEPQPAPQGATSRVFSSPLARRLARESGLDLATLTGSGPGGRVVRRDVEAALADRDAAAADAPAPSTPATSAGTAVAAAGAAVPHSPMRRLIAARLSESKRNIPHFYLRGSARVDRLLALRAELNEAAESKISINDLIVKAVACAHRAVPAVNVLWGPDAVTQLPHVDIAVAIATPTGLVTPVLRGVDQMPIGRLAAASRDLVERAQTGRIKQAELEGGSITVTNLGMFGTSEFAAIINPPQSSILAVGAVATEAVADEDGQVQVAHVVHVTLSVDHRPIDGATAATWMQALVQVLEHPARMLV